MPQSNDELLKWNIELDAQLVDLTKILETMIRKIDVIESELIEMRKLMVADINSSKL